MAQDAYNVTKAMRVRGLDADLLAMRADVFSFPAWEDGLGENVSDPANPGKAFENYVPPPYIRVCDFPRITPGLDVILRFRILRKIFEEYDVVFAHMPGSLYAQFSGVPFVPYDGGLIRYLDFGQGPSLPSARRPAYRLLRRSYKVAKRILFTNPDTIRLFEKYGLAEKLVFTPFVIPSDVYHKVAAAPKVRELGDPVFLSPTRQNWREKGNDKMLQAFAQFVEDHSKAHLILGAWGEDLNQSEHLCDRLNLKQHVSWLKPVNKRRLIELYGSVDGVLDQFTLGSWGTTTPEAMSCECPVIMYYDSDVIIKCFGSLPPFRPSFMVSEIVSRMETLYTQDGRANREWVALTHNGDIVVDRHLQAARVAMER